MVAVPGLAAPAKRTVQRAILHLFPHLKAIAEATDTPADKVMAVVEVEVPLLLAEMVPPVMVEVEEMVPLQQFLVLL